MKPAAVLAALALAGVPGVLLAGCEAGVGPRTVARADLEQQLTRTYAAGNDALDVTCSGDLAAEIGSTQDCQLQSGADSANARVKVDSVDGGDVHFVVTPFVPAARVAETIREQLAHQGYRVDTVTCAAELVGRVGEASACTAVPAQGGGTITATVTRVRGLRVSFDYRLVG
ncbi:MAG: DUF4333 domain-containing protein [Nocardioides sp.]